MPNIKEMSSSKFLKKEDCGAGILVTVKEVFQENVAKEGADPDLKWCCAFDETDKPLVLNTTNTAIIAAICGSEETDDWAGQKVVLYADMNIMFQGKLVGGIRARAPRQKAKPEPARSKLGKKIQPQSPEPEPQSDNDGAPF